MFKLAFPLWMLIGTVLAGAAVIVVVAVPSFYDMGMKLIPMVVAVGFAISIPLAYVLAKKITSLTSS